MKSETFKKNVLKTMTVKSVKLGMRVASKNSTRTVLATATVGLKRDVGNLIRGLSQYVLGMQMNQGMKEAALLNMGDVGANLVVLAKVLKVKVPTSTKKAKLAETRTAALLQLDGASTDMLAIVAESVFTAPKMVTVKKMVVMPTKGGIKEERDVQVIDSEADKAAETARVAQLKTLLESAVDVYWRLCFDIFGIAPAEVFKNKLGRMKEMNPSIDFQMVDPEPKKKQIKDAA